MTETPTKLRILETLVEELLKDAPEERRVREYMSAAGLEDKNDHVDRINTVLHALHFEEIDKGFAE